MSLESLLLLLLLQQSYSTRFSHSFLFSPPCAISMRVVVQFTVPESVFVHFFLYISRPIQTMSWVIQRTCGIVQGASLSLLPCFLFFTCVNIGFNLFTKIITVETVTSFRLSSVRCSLTSNRDFFTKSRYFILLAIIWDSIDASWKFGGGALSISCFHLFWIKFCFVCVTKNNFKKCVLDYHLDVYHLPQVTIDPASSVPFFHKYFMLQVFKSLVFVIKQVCNGCVSVTAIK